MKFKFRVRGPSSRSLIIASYLYTIIIHEFTRILGYAWTRVTKDDNKGAPSLSSLLYPLCSSHETKRTFAIVKAVASLAHFWNSSSENCSKCEISAVFEFNKLVMGRLRRRGISNVLGKVFKKKHQDHHMQWQNIILKTFLFRKFEFDYT